MRRCALVVIALVFGCSVPAPAGSAGEPPSIANPAVQSAIAAAVQRDRVFYGGKTPVPAA